MTVDGTAIERAKELVNASRYADGAALLRTYLAAHPEDPVAWHRLAGALLGAEDNDGALEAADRSIELDPANHVAYRYRALACLPLKRYEELRTAAARADELAPNDPESLTLLAHGVAFADRDWAAASAIANRALSLAPDNRAARATALSFRRARIKGLLLTYTAPLFALAFVLGCVEIAVVSDRPAAAWLLLPSAAAVIVVVPALGWTRKWPSMPLRYGGLSGAIVVNAVIAGLCTWAATGRPGAAAVAAAATAVLAGAMSVRLLVALARRGVR